ncbi:MAG: hypothetical protein ACT4NY_03265 [Pseudonocardiales bacterium]
MPRRNFPRRARDAAGSRQDGARQDQPALNALGWGHRESGPDGEWVVRTVPGGQSVKSYRCPGCDHEIRPGIAHLVVWPAGEEGSLADRRHWHTSCWAARARRGPTRKRW